MKQTFQENQLRVQGHELIFHPVKKATWCNSENADTTDLFLAKRVASYVPTPETGEEEKQKKKRGQQVLSHTAIATYEVLSASTSNNRHDSFYPRQCVFVERHIVFIQEIRRTKRPAEQGTKSRKDGLLLISSRRSSPGHCLSPETLYEISKKDMCLIFGQQCVTISVDAL